jgi:hypothetical protein
VRTGQTTVAAGKICLTPLIVLTEIFFPVSVPVDHRGKLKSLTQDQRRALKRRQAIEPVIGHLKANHRLNRCWLQGETGDAIHAVLCAVGYNLRWLLRAIARGPLDPAFLCLIGQLLRALKNEGGHACGRPMIGFRSAYAGS